MKFNKNYLRLYAVTDQSWTGEKTLAEQVEEALKGGVTLVQIREKEAVPDEFLKQAVRIHHLTQKYQVPLIVNDNVQVMLGCDAEGIHIGQDDMEVAAVRGLIGPEKILGVTAKTVDQALYAQQRGADYLGVGAVFGSMTKKDAMPISIEMLTEICKAVTIPVVAIGGINADNIQLLNGCGAAGAAVVSAIFAQTDILNAARELRKMAEEI